MNVSTRDLQDQVCAAELRVMTRDAALRRRVELARERWQRTMQQARWLPLAAGAAAAAAALWWLLKRGRHTLAAPAATGAARRAVPSGGGHWLGAIGLLWPLLPARWRTRVNPATAGAFASIGLPLLEWLLLDRSPPPATAIEVDLARYMGTWHEIARLPTRFERRCAGQPSATYTLRGGGVHIVNRCIDHEGREQIVAGEGRVVPGSGNAMLQVSLWPRLLRWLPLAWAEHFIVHVDAQYRFAVVGDRSRRHCWLLAREPRPEPRQREQLMQIAAAQGYPVEQLRHSDDAGFVAHR